MFEFLFQPANAPFTVSLLIVLLLGVLDFVGIGVSAFETDIGHPEIDASHGHGFLDWLKIGEVPLVIILCTALGLFGLSGLLLQQTAHNLSNHYLPLLIAIPATVGITLPLLGFATSLLARFAPTETYVVDPADFVGKRATLLSRATSDVLGRATLKDIHGTTHYLMVYANDHPLESGEECILWKREGNTFVAIPTFESGGIQV